MPHLTLILGGAASGKSRFAEELAAETGRRQIYIATAQAFDKEMEAKIKRHKIARGTEWETIEAPLDATPAINSAKPDDVILLDCATLWLSNVMLAKRAWEPEADRLLASLATCKAPVVVVSNETGMGIVPDHPLGRAFRNAQGALNQRLASQSDRAALIVAGLPLSLKGGF
ncbi:MAG: bifunctional adenosylcobinamide kinase/adenosylcobinamide-phosphate guanylyltransferase [Pseudomonadota bacterium]